MKKVLSVLFMLVFMLMVTVLFIASAIAAPSNYAVCITVRKDNTHQLGQVVSGVCRANDRIYMVPKPKAKPKPKQAPSRTPAPNKPLNPNRSAKQWTV